MGATDADDAVPDVDRIEGQTPPEPDLRFGHVHRDERPEADVLEQEISTVEISELPDGRDAERLEPVDDSGRPHEDG
jgi:hypothetical protein